MAMPAVNAFVETAALYAVLNEDIADAERIVADMLPNERAEFAAQLDRLRSLLTDRFGNDRGSSNDMLGILFADSR